MTLLWIASKNPGIAVNFRKEDAMSGETMTKYDELWAAIEAAQETGDEAVLTAAQQALQLAIDQALTVTGLHELYHTVSQRIIDESPLPMEYWTLFVQSWDDLVEGDAKAAHDVLLKVVESLDKRLNEEAQ